MLPDKKPLHVAVSGGIAEIILAITLYHHGIPVTVYEQAPTPKPCKYVIMFDYLDGYNEGSLTKT
ncbi:salicylate hydroxylase [Penicillium hispanicum]|uniref:salicylate hydroxylase n=1 Tax=Penicillium hispanicum TaxID=1080232 RepID=UPI002541232A|nr:salicylate hydroxylase [Penicillium hispanicum]KAJ5584515.1 salicylate hydroxylase [Penicillium hispanicum]